MPKNTEYKGPIPDDSITITEMNEYGYTYELMLPLDTEKALKYYDSDVLVYLLYEDDTEGMAEERSDIENHKGIFGVEIPDWERYLAEVAAKAEELSEPEIDDDMDMEM